MKRQGLRAVPKFLLINYLTINKIVTKLQNMENQALQDNQKWFHNPICFHSAAVCLALIPFFVFLSLKIQQLKVSV